MALVLNRRALVALVFVAASPAAALPICRPPRVLFVCPAGTVKSAIARELFKREAAAASIPVEVRSRGIAIEDHITPAFAARLKADRIDLAAQPPAVLGSADAQWADIVIAFDEAIDSPLLMAKQAWRTPSWLADYDTALADMNTRLDGLLVEVRDMKVEPQPCVRRADSAH
jgi:protein-tyrosine-phosphatase